MISFVKITSVTSAAFGKVFSGIGALGSIFTDRAYYQQTGFSSIPRDSARGIVIRQGNNYTCVASADKLEDQPELTTKGDVAIYTSSDMYITIKATGEIEIVGNGAPGSVSIGAGALRNLMTSDMIIKYLNHTHSGVTTGAGVSGTPVTGLINSGDATTETVAG